MPPWVTAFSLIRQGAMRPPLRNSLTGCSRREGRTPVTLGKSGSARDTAEATAEASPAAESADSIRSKLNDMLPKKLIQVFQFRSLDDVISASKAVQNFYKGSNSLYKTEADQNNYELILHQSGMSPVDFYRTCNILSEYGTCSTVDEAGEAFLREHGTSLIASNALYRLSQL